MRAAIEEVTPSLSAPTAGGREVKKHRHQRGCAVAHRGIDHLALAGFAGLEKCGEHADDQVKRAAAEIADKIERWDWSLGRPDRRQRARDCNIVDVMAGGLCQWAFLAPSRHAAINEPRIP